MANKRIHDLDDTATTLDSGAYIAVDSDSYTAAKKFAADTLPDPTGATDGYVWTADGANGAAWEAVSGGASDVTDLTTTTGSSTNMVRVAAAGGLEYRTTAQVLSDIGALAATGSVTGATSQAQAFTSGVTTGANGVDVNPGSDIDADLITVGVTGSPNLKWDESEDWFAWNKAIYVPDNLILDPSADQVILRGNNSDMRFDIRAGNTEAQSSYFTFYSRSYNNPATRAGNIDIISNTGGGYGYIRFTQYNGASSWPVRMGIFANGKVGIGENLSTSPDAQLSVTQWGTTTAIPVLHLKQLDVSEDMIEFEATIGTGNAIEAVGAKTLTVTHYVKCTITGVGERYIALGTIA